MYISLKYTEKMSKLNDLQLWEKVKVTIKVE